MYSKRFVTLEAGGGALEADGDALKINKITLVLMLKLLIYHVVCRICLLNIKMFA